MIAVRDIEDLAHPLQQPGSCWLKRIPKQTHSRTRKSGVYVLGRIRFGPSLVDPR